MSHAEKLHPIGMVARLNADQRAGESLQLIRKFRFPVFQLGGIHDALLFGPRAGALRAELRSAMAETNSECSALWLTFPGQQWTRENGPATVGLAPEALRAERLMRAAMIADLADELAVDTLAVHLGFPPHEGCPAYEKFISDLRMFLHFLSMRRMRLIFETGQESAIILNSMLASLSMANAGINFDPANFLIYGTDNPLTALDTLAGRIVNVHIKDGVRPTPPALTGREVRFGDGEVQAEHWLRRLDELGYRGPWIIEREISGDAQVADIRHTVELLQGLGGFIND